MPRSEIQLYTAQRLEELLGKKFFYRQSFYRLGEEGFVKSFNVDGTSYFSSEEIVDVVMQRLLRRLRNRFPWLQNKGIRIKFDFGQTGNRISLYGGHKGFKLEVDTSKETEEEFLRKVEKAREEVIKMQDFPLDQPPSPPHGAPPPPPPGPPGPHHPPPPPPPHHEAIMEALRRIEDTLKRIEDKLE